MPVTTWYCAERELQAGWQGLTRTLELRYLAVKIQNQDDFDSWTDWFLSLSPDEPFAFERIPVEEPHMLVLVSVTNAEPLDAREAGVLLDDAGYIMRVRWEEIPGIRTLIPYRMLENAIAAIGERASNRVQERGLPGIMFLISDEAVREMTGMALHERAAEPVEA